MDQPDLTARQFGDMAANYLSSPVHATGADLDRLVAQARRLAPARALDLGCGAGHVAFALARAGVPKVIAYDLSQAMLDLVEQESRTRGYSAIEIGKGPANGWPSMLAVSI
jgi:2-polyprenyl-3-methyl-5-hydroxy-6-metoxy-1,4-benzoquinol methylase